MKPQREARRLFASFYSASTIFSSQKTIFSFKIDLSYKFAEDMPHEAR
jgi:hypothetical protein